MRTAKFSSSIGRVPQGFANWMILGGFWNYLLNTVVKIIREMALVFR